LTWPYGEALDWLYARQALGIKLGLGKVRRLLSALGDPHRAYKVIHVAGTNGKGSVTRMVAGVLLRSGARVGTTTSPHLVSFTERIEVDGRPVNEATVAEGLARLRPAVAQLDGAGEPPTFFEVVTALAFLCFRDAGIEWAVIETGMGGRLDATNVVQPELTIITNVAIDHRQHLGPTVADIAFEKAGIMKPGVPCVTGCTGDALTVLAARSHELRVPMSIVGGAGDGEVAGGPRSDYHVVGDAARLVLLRPTGESRYEVGLAGAHQRGNAAIVVAAVEALRRLGHAIPERAVRDALRETRHPGRLDLFQVPASQLADGCGPRSVSVLVDGAHNPAAGRALRQHLLESGWQGFHLVAGFCADKDWRATLEEWLPPCAHAWAVPVRNPRTLDPAALEAAAQAAGVRADVAPDAATAIALAVRAGADRIVVAGSLFLAGEAIARLTGAPLEGIRGSQ
jgi:dihydrofolate synthase/folylpolyglutamate synthase